MPPRALTEAAQAHPDKRLSLWFEDEARVGNKGRVCHRWFLEGRCPTAICDRRFEWAYIFSPERPATGEDFTLVLPEVSAGAMDLFLGKFAETLPEDSHAWTASGTAPAPSSPTSTARSCSPSCGAIPPPRAPPGSARSAWPPSSPSTGYCGRRTPAELLARLRAATNGLAS